MEVKIIKNILTAIGNPFLNSELKNSKEFNVINDDIQYQDGIFEILEVNSKIDLIILSQLIPGKLSINELIEKIQNINSKIKIILILEKYNEEYESALLNNGVYRIFYNEKIEINDVIKIINEDDKMEKYNEEIRKEIDELKEYIIKNNKKINNNIFDKNEEINNKKILKKEKNNLLYYFVNKINLNKIKKYKVLLLKNKINEKYLLNKNNNKKIISILGNNGAGKSVFSVMLANYYKKKYKKILIFDFDILNNSLHTILGVKKYPEKIKKIIEKNDFNKNEITVENLIININKKIDLISGINLVFDSNNKINENKMKNIMEKLSNNYEIIIIDTTSECFFEYTKELIKISNESIFLVEPNLIEISKSKRLLDLYNINWNIEKEKINIIFNKVNKSSIDINLLKKVYDDYKVLGSIKLKKNYNEILKNINNYELKKYLTNKFDFINNMRRRTI